MVRLLYRYNYNRKDTRQVLRLIDWMINLSKEQIPVFIQHTTAIEQEYHMSYVTSFERHGQVTLLQSQLTRKFGPLPQSIQQCLENAESNQLETWALNFVDAQTLDDVFAE